MAKRTLFQFLYHLTEAAADLVKEPIQLRKVKRAIESFSDDLASRTDEASTRRLNLEKELVRASDETAMKAVLRKLYEEYVALEELSAIASWASDYKSKLEAPAPEEPAE